MLAQMEFSRCHFTGTQKTPLQTQLRMISRFLELIIQILSEKKGYDRPRRVVRKTN